MKASRSAAQTRWLKKNEDRDHFTRLADRIRMQQWRAAHPGYWRQRVKVGRLQVRGELAEVIRDLALQDMIDAHFSLLVGLVSHLTATASQDEIASEIRRLTMLGHGMLLQSAGATDFPQQPKSKIR